MKCGKRFAHACSLRKHTRIHNNEKGKEDTEILSQHDVKTVIINAESLSNVSVIDDI